MVAERQVEKMQKFVKDYSAKMNEIEEALDESLVRSVSLRVGQEALPAHFSFLFLARSCLTRSLERSVGPARGSHRCVLLPPSRLTNLLSLPSSAHSRTARADQRARALQDGQSSIQQADGDLRLPRGRGPAPQETRTHSLLERPSPARPLKASQAVEKIYPPFVLFGELYGLPSEGEVQLQIGTHPITVALLLQSTRHRSLLPFPHQPRSSTTGRMLEFLNDFTKFVARSYLVVQNIVRQLASLYHATSKLWSNSFRCESCVACVGVRSCVACMSTWASCVCASMCVCVADRPRSLETSTLRRCSRRWATSSW